MMVHRFADARAAAQACGAHILDCLRAVIGERGAATLAISGGSSPKTMFEDFAGAPFPWKSVHLFWVDERCVPPSDPQSNFKLAADAWLTPAGFPSTNIHRIQAELEPRQAAERYGEEIRSYLPFDVIHRGMGPDGHTASLFPGASDPPAPASGVSAVWVEKMQQWRVTLTAPVLEAARHTAMLVTGPDKAPMLRAVLEGPYDPRRFPAQIASRGADWFIDEAAAAELSR